MKDPDRRHRSRRWWFWTVYTATLIMFFFVGAVLSVIVGANPYVGGCVLVGGAILRITYQTRRGNFYCRWWDHL